MMQVAARILLVTTLLSCGCRTENEPSVHRLPVIKVEIGGHPTQLEVADEPAATAQGLMFRRELAEDTGMLFVFDRPRRAAFWMKNTYIPLSIAFLNEAGTILEIKHLEPEETEIVRSESASVAYAIEMNQGWFAEYNISPGAQVAGLEKLR